MIGKKLPIMAALLLILCLMTIGCGKKYSGNYIGENPGESLQLRKDGTFYVKQKADFFPGGFQEVIGTWEVEGNQIRLIWQGMVSSGSVRGNKITDDEGKVWTKR